jgi:hypothetical protein
MVVMNKLVIVCLLLTVNSQGVIASEPDNLGMFKGRKRSELPDNYREINTPAKLKAFQQELETVPKNARTTKIDGETYHCVNRGGHDLLSGMRVSDMRCWQK